MKINLHLLENGKWQKNKKLTLKVQKFKNNLKTNKAFFTVKTLKKENNCSEINFPTPIFHPM